MGEQVTHKVRSAADVWVHELSALPACWKRLSQSRTASMKLARRHAPCRAFKRQLRRQYRHQRPVHRCVQLSDQAGTPFDLHTTAADENEPQPEAAGEEQDVPPAPEDRYKNMNRVLRGCAFDRKWSVATLNGNQNCALRAPQSVHGDSKLSKGELSRLSRRTCHSALLLNARY